MTPAIIAHYLVAIAVIAVFLTIALIREALIREAADRRRDEEFDRMRAAARAAARRRTDALYLDFARRAGAAGRIEKLSGSILKELTGAATVAAAMDAIRNGMTGREGFAEICFCFSYLEACVIARTRKERSE